LPTGYKKIVINTAELLGHLTTVSMYPTGQTNIQMVEYLRVITFMMTWQFITSTVLSAAWSSLC